MRKLATVLFVLFVASVPSSRAASSGEAYVAAYNDLARMYNDRWAAVGSANQVQLKDTNSCGGASVTQADLDVLRLGVIRLLSNFYVVGSSPGDPNAPAAADAFPMGLRKDGPTLVLPSLMQGIGFNGCFTKIPAEFTTGGQGIYTNTFADAPLLWIHFDELQRAMQRMTVSITTPGRGTTTSHYALVWGPSFSSFADAEAACAAAVQPSVPTYLPIPPPGGTASLGYSEQRDDNYFPARTTRVFSAGLSSLKASYYVNAGITNVRTVHFYAFARRNGTEWNAPASLNENQWSAWSHADAAATGRVYSATLGYDTVPEWCADPPVTQGAATNNSWGFYIADNLADIRAVTEWRDLYTTTIIDPGADDAEADGLVTRSECASCQAACGAKLDDDDIRRCGHVVYHLGKSSGLTNLLSVSADLREYQVGGQPRQMFSLDTRIISRTADTTQGWDFVTLKRPTGAEIVFTLAGAGKKGWPLNGKGYRLRAYGASGFELSFPSAGNVVHRFTDGQNLSGVYEESKPWTLLSRSGDNWPGLQVARAAPLSGNVLTVKTARVVSEFAYTNCLVQAVISRDTNGNVLARNVLTNGSRIFMKFDAASNLVKVLHLFDRPGLNETEIWFGDSTSTPAKVSLRKEFPDLTNSTVVMTKSVGLPATGETNTDAVARQSFAWGWEKVQDVRGYGGENPLVTTYSYYTNAADTSNYARLQRVEDADGSWSRFEYDNLGRLSVTVTPFKNADPTAATNLCRVTRNYYAGDAILAGLGVPADITFTNDDRPRLVIEQALGFEVGRTYYAYYGSSQVVKRCATAGAAWTATNSLATVTHFLTNGIAAGRPRRIENEDGTLSLYGYGFDSAANQLISTNDTGAGTTTVTNGARSITWTDPEGLVLQQKSIDLPSGQTVGQSINGYDSLGRLVVASNVLSGLATKYAYSCCDHPDAVVDQDGIVTVNAYDALDQLLSATRLGVTTWFTYDADGRQVRVRRSAAGMTDLITGSGYDDAGRLVASTNELGTATTFAETVATNGERTTTSTNPDQTTQVGMSYRDGRSKSEAGTAVHPQFFDYGVDANGEFTIAYQGPDATAAEWVKSYQNLLGQNWLTVYPDGYAVTNYFDARGRQVRTADGLTQSLVAYDGNSRAWRQVVDLNINGTIDLAGTDRISENFTRATNLAGTVVVESQSIAYPTNSSGTPLVMGLSRRSADGKQSWSIAFGRTNSTVTTWNPAATTRTETVTAPDSTKRFSFYTNGLLAAAEWRNSTNGTISRTFYAYDGFSRLTSIAETAPDGSTRVTTMACDAAGQQTSIVVSAGALQQATFYQYDIMGRRTRTVLPDGGVVTYKYADTGELVEQSGARSYPVRYTYNSQGRLDTLSTYRNGLSGPPDVTTWLYNSQRGFVLSKRYVDGTSVAYSDLPNGQLKRRTWARGSTTDYFYDRGSSLTNIQYSAGTSNVVLGLDRLGRATTIRDGAGTHTNVFLGDGSPVLQTFGYLPAFRLEDAYDALGRATNVAVRFVVSKSSTLTLMQEQMTFDGAGRLARVADGTWAADYAYAADGRAIARKTFTRGGVQVMGVTNTYDGLGRLAQVASSPTNGPALSYAYAYNLADQRTTNALADGSRWEYAYDDLGQVIAGRKILPGGAVRPGYQWDYDFDTIGNRKSARAQGVEETYAANGLNQYVSRTAPQVVVGVGTAKIGAVVNVGLTNTVLSRAGRSSNFYVQVISLTNGAGPALVTNVTLAYTVTNTNILVRSVAQSVLVRPVPERYIYDADGNLVSDGLYSNVWDGENRLVQTETLTNVPDGAKVRIVNQYDYKGRRIRKTAYSLFSNGLYRATNTCTYLYDGWNVLAELGTGATNYYRWGLDLSGSPQGAGGIGGLLLMTRGTNAYFYAYDGNGNVMALVNAANGATAAEYEYGPFGETLKADGTAATNNNFRFSTKYLDREVGLYYYGFRYYRPDIGRFLMHDPIEENGGLNLYAFVANRSVSKYDLLGLTTRGDIGHTLFYTCNCGWVDVNHADSSAAQGLWDQIKDGRPQAAKPSLHRDGYVIFFTMDQTVPVPHWFHLPILHDNRFRTAGGQYYVANGMGLAEKKMAGLGIFKDISRSFETQQGRNLQESTFSEEDLVSDLIAFYMAAEGISQPDVFKLCGKVSDQESRNIWDREYGPSGQLGKNDQFTPKYHDCGECKEKPKWPEKFTTIRDASKGTLWDTWNESTDF